MKREFFPLWRHRTVAMYYVFNTSINALFMAGVWAFIWGRFMTNQQIGISDAMSFALGFIIEIPAGVIADVFGRRRTLIFSCIAMLVGNAFLDASSSFWGITLSYFVWTLGWGFQSGAADALTYDYLKSIKMEADWGRVKATATTLATIIYPPAIAIGGLLYGVWFRLPYLACAIFGLIPLIAVILQREVRNAHTHAQHHTFRNYAIRVRDGMSVLIRKNVVPVAIAAMAVGGLQVAYVWGLLRPYIVEGFGYNQVQVPVVLAVIALITGIALPFVTRLRKKVGLVRLLFICAFTYALAFASYVLPFNQVEGVVAVTVAAVASAYIDQLFSVFINRHAHDEHRATTLSTVALITRAPYVVLAIVVGGLVDQHLLPLFSLVAGLVVLFVVIIGRSLLKHSGTDLA